MLPVVHSQTETQALCQPELTMMIASVGLNSMI